LVSPGERRRKDVEERLAGWIDFIGYEVQGVILVGFFEVFARGAIGIDNAFGKQVVYGLACSGNIGSEDVIEAAVLTEDNDHVLDRRDGGRWGLCPTDYW
jgi:hypothetical protein